MVQTTNGNLLAAEVEALVNAVNCVGVMGRGIALQFREAFPDNYTAYKTACDRGELRPGRMFVFDLQRETNPRFIINFPTKRHWRDKSRLEDIQAGMSSLVEEIRQRRISSIAIPPLGCGLGGLDWSDVRPIIETALTELPDVVTLIYEPTSPPRELTKSRASR